MRRAVILKTSVAEAVAALQTADALRLKALDGVTRAPADAKTHAALTQATNETRSRRDHLDSLHVALLEAEKLDAIDSASELRDDQLKAKAEAIELAESRQAIGAEIDEWLNVLPPLLTKLRVVNERIHERIQAAAEGLHTMPGVEGSGSQMFVGSLKAVPLNAINTSVIGNAFLHGLAAAGLPDRNAGIDLHQQVVFTNAQGIHGAARITVAQAMFLAADQIKDGLTTLHKRTGVIPNNRIPGAVPGSNITTAKGPHGEALYDSNGDPMMYAAVIAPPTPGPAHAPEETIDAVGHEWTAKP